MKFQFLIAFTAYLLNLTSADDKNCNFTIDQLNSKVLKTVIVEDCDNCFTSDVTLTIQSNINKSLLFNQLQSNLMTLQKAIQYSTPRPIISNLISSCQTKQINGQLTYDLTFLPQINEHYQAFRLNVANAGKTSNSLLISVAYISMIICIILFF
ncbi:transmembrane protein, putative (macronuclear) [Tetrahymena thermophila SB210]|uniref:Transmembrane protein, putative n=1 Tax=Tetrahymena thermophila (strain SB210) TaxID=312017 RepID=W7X5D7_TETTS|nr:transmembrane protein, putative [Tetrahymena thermophila SB210]EWS74585.1 transmembrane protein, putative [Tetrahymena thermophila SB210]|eukprot:XP_012652886.1 transmembrane protein, putative [Tetrahymena thermophila SB210]